MVIWLNWYLLKAKSVKFSSVSFNLFNPHYGIYTEMLESWKKTDLMTGFFLSNEVTFHVSGGKVNKRITRIWGTENTYT